MIIASGENKYDIYTGNQNRQYKYQTGQIKNITKNIGLYARTAKILEIILLFFKNRKISPLPYT